MKRIAAILLLLLLLWIPAAALATDFHSWDTLVHLTSRAMPISPRFGTARKTEVRRSIL